MKAEDEREIDKTLDEAKFYTIEDRSGFIGEEWYSTDGKHTVHYKAYTKEGRENGHLWAKQIYDEILLQRGTKQAQAVKEYSKPANNGQPAEGWCTIHKIQMRQFAKEGQSWYSHRTDSGWCNGRAK